MKKVLFLILILASVQASAQNMKTIISNMPDSITPLLTKNARLNFIDYIEAGQKAVERNYLTGASEMTKLSDTRAVIKTSNRSTMDFKLLKNPEERIGIITTVKSDSIGTSIIKYYTLDWKLVKTVTPSTFKQYEWNDENEELKETIFDPLKLKQDDFKK